MREEILALLKAVKFGTITVTEELPWAKDGQELYMKNFRRIYVDQPTTAQEPLINTLGGASIVTETTALMIYLAVDAKNPPANLNLVVDSIRQIRSQVEIQGRVDRTCSVNQRFEADALVTEFELSFKKLLTT